MRLKKNRRRKEALRQHRMISDWTTQIDEQKNANNFVFFANVKFLRRFYRFSFKKYESRRVTMYSCQSLYYILFGHSFHYINVYEGDDTLDSRHTCNLNMCRTPHNFIVFSLFVLWIWIYSINAVVRIADCCCCVIQLWENVSNFHFVTEITSNLMSNTRNSSNAQWIIKKQRSLIVSRFLCIFDFFLFSSSIYIFIFLAAN